jgi:diguanylate cyclase (GGDEF)-like protein
MPVFRLLLDSLKTALQIIDVIAIAAFADKRSDASSRPIWRGTPRMEHKLMISLKRYLDSKAPPVDEPEVNRPSGAFLATLSAYRSALTHFGECGANTCPDLAAELKRGLTRLDEELGDQPGLPAINKTREALRELLQNWGDKTAQYYQQKSGEVKDLLLVIARTTDWLGVKDDQYGHQLDSLTSQLETIAKLQDVTTIRASVEESARQLKNSVTRMTAENKVVIDHLRAEVSTYRAKLEKAEYTASCDALTGLGTRLWAEACIQTRVESGNPFCILMIDVQGFRGVNHEYGNLVGDLILKEFARELRSSCRISDLVARWAGDEFIVVLDCAATDARVQVARLQTRICGPYLVPGRSGHVSVRLNSVVGLTEYRDGDCLQAILERADAALCDERKQSRGEMTA